MAVVTAPGAEGGLLASLKPMILQLVKEAVQQAVQELLGSGFSCSGQASSAGSQPQHNSEQPNKPRRKPKGKGTGDHPPEQAQCNSSTRVVKREAKAKALCKASPSSRPKKVVEDRARQASPSRVNNRKRVPEKASQMRMAGFRSAAKLQMKISDFFPQDWDKPLLEFSRLADTLDGLQPDKILEAVILSYLVQSS